MIQSLTTKLGLGFVGPCSLDHGGGITKGEEGGGDMEKCINVKELENCNYIEIIDFISLY